MKSRGRPAGWLKHPDWAHGTVYGYRSRKCRCDQCRAAHAAHIRVYEGRRRMDRRGGLRVRTSKSGDARHQIRDTDTPTAMQACSCSLAGWDPPWCWTWVPWKPFHEMSPTPTGAEYEKDWRSLDWRRHVYTGHWWKWKE